jgi:N-methylhydantoinase A/oxoprolinase/acetone carboxylase beta subunit
VSRIGIDVGGTNTDAALVERTRVLATVKTPTTEDVLAGVETALTDLMKAAPEALSSDAVVVGTTQFTNAVVQRRGLQKVAVLRIGLPTGATRPRASGSWTWKTSLCPTCPGTSGGCGCA